MLIKAVKNLLKNRQSTARLDKEIPKLKEYFMSKEGMFVLLNLYAQAEINILTEPAGLLEMPSKKFHYFDISDRKKDYLVSLLINEKPKFKALINELENKILKYENMKDFDNADKCRFFLSEFKIYIKKDGDLEKILSLLQHYLTSSYATPNNLPEGIEIHMHPNKPLAIKNNKQLIVFETKKGYSPADIFASSDKTLCLIEYKKKNNTSDVFNPFLELELDIFHRISDAEKTVDNYNLIIDAEKATLANPDDEKVQIPTPKLKLTNNNSEFLLYENKHLWPFLESVKKGEFDFHHYFYTNITPKKRFQVVKNGESRELYMQGPDPFKRLFLNM